MATTEGNITIELDCIKYLHFLNKCLCKWVIANNNNNTAIVILLLKLQLWICYILPKTFCRIILSSYSYLPSIFEDISNSVFTDNEIGPGVTQQSLQTNQQQNENNRHTKSVQTWLWLSSQTEQAKLKQICLCRTSSVVTNWSYHPQIAKLQRHVSNHPTSSLLPFSHTKYFMGECFEIMNVGYS